MKLSTRKNLIRLIAIFFILLGAYILLQDIFKIFIYDFSYGLLLIFGWFYMWFLWAITIREFIILFIILYLTASIGLWLFKEWGRFLAYILSVISLVSTAVVLVMGVIMYLTEDPMKNISTQIILPLLCSPVFLYLIIILGHKDTKLIFEHKGKIEGLEKSK
jgi:hypothetical protein